MLKMVFNNNKLENKYKEVIEIEGVIFSSKKYDRQH